MQLTTFLAPENIRQGVLVSSKKRALELIGKMIADYVNRKQPPEAEELLCPISCFSNLFQREKLGSTALNNGVALPHAKLPPQASLILDEPIAVFLQLETPIDYEAADHKEVDLIYALLFPEQNCEQYRTDLHQIAQTLTNRNLMKHLRSAQSSEEIQQILAYADQHQGENDE